MKKVSFGLITLALVIGTFLGCANSSSSTSSQGASSTSGYSQESTAQSVFSQPVFSQASISTPSQAVTSTAVLSQVSKSSSSQKTTSMTVSSKASTSVPVSATSVFSQPVQPSSDNETYIIANNIFVGSFKNGVWRSSGFTVAEVLSHSYKLYRQDGTTRAATYISAQLSNNLKRISANDANLLIPFATGTSESNAYTFALPTIFTGAAAQVPMALDSPILYFNDLSYPLATNASFNPIPRPVNMNITPDDHIKQTVRSVLDSFGLPGAPVNITHVYACDLTGDGRTQQIVIANTPLAPISLGFCSLVSPDEYQNNNSGNYSVCLIIDGANVKILKEVHAKYETKNNVTFDKSTGFYDDYDNYSQMIFPGCFDINHDGKYEILLGEITLGVRTESVFTMDNTSTWTEVLTSKFGPN